MKLFEDKNRDYDESAVHGQDAYSFYDKTRLKKYVEVRELLNKWFDHYPEQSKLELKQSFKNNFNHAFFELFIHETFFRQGYILETHPILINSEKKPDFLAKKSDQEFYIEATTVSYFSELERKKENFRQKFIHELNKMEAPNFWLILKELKFKNENFPKVTQLRKAFEGKLNELSKSDLDFDLNNILSNLELKFEDDNLLIKVTLNKKNEAQQNSIDSKPIAVQYYPVEIKDAMEDSVKILKSFKNKATRYGELEKPFIICLNLDFNFNLIHDVDSAFYSRDGFLSPSPKFTKASAVFLSNVNDGNIFRCPSHRIIKNTKARFAFNLDELQISFEENGVLTDKKDINEILELEGKNYFGFQSYFE